MLTGLILVGLVAVLIFFASTLGNRRAPVGRMRSGDMIWRPGKRPGTREKPATAG